MKKSQVASQGDVSESTRPRGRRKQPRELREAKEALYREHIMDVAERMFAEQGFAETKMQDVAREAGISLGTLYQAYPGKADLYRALLISRDNEMLNSAMQRAQKIFKGLESVEQLLWMMQAHIDFLLNHPNYLLIQLQEGYAWYHSASRPSSDEQQLWERGMAMMEQVFNWGASQGLFVVADTADRARLMMAMQQTRLANWVTHGMAEDHASVVALIQADFVRNFCLPAVAVEMMSEDGVGLNEKTIARLRALD